MLNRQGCHNSGEPITVVPECKNSMCICFHPLVISDFSLGVAVITCVLVDVVRDFSIFSTKKELPW